MEIVFLRHGCPPFSKQPTICKKVDNCISPIVYFQKPKNASKADFDAAVNFIIRQAEKTIQK